MKKIHFARLHAFWFRVLVSILLAAVTLVALSACTESSDTRKPKLNSRLASTYDFASLPDPGLLLLLVLQAQILTDPLVTAWLDAASEIGVRIQPITDRQFKNLGMAALNYAGLILPD